MELHRSIADNIRDYTLAVKHDPSRNYNIRGIAVGTAGKKTRQLIVPIVTPREEVVIAEKWGIVPSQANRPKIQANSDGVSGLIVRIDAAPNTGTNNTARPTGRLYVAADSVGLTNLIAHGIANDVPDTDAGSWDECIFVLKPGATVYAQGTLRWRVYHYAPEGQLLTYELEYVSNAGRVRITDSHIQRWQRAIKE